MVQFYRHRQSYFVIFLVLFALGVFSFHSVSLAEESSAGVDTSLIEKLRDQISDRNDEIKKLEEEIAALDASLKKTEGQTKSLKNEVLIINNTISQLNKQVRVTETKIKSTELNIQKLVLEINNKESNISDDRVSVGEMMQTIQQVELQSPIEIILSEQSFGDGWEEIDFLERIQNSVKERILDLEKTKKSLEENKAELAQDKADLNKLRSNLLDQKSIASRSKASKDKLIAQTKNQEANYRKMLAETEAKKESLEKELFNFEAQLKVAIDPASYPKSGNRVLSWPLKSPYITQKFGKTSDSGRLYVSGTHNGADFRARVGTPIFAASSGTVVGVGDTDIACRGASYGKWILIKHPNGLATLYAHLELIKVSAGQEVSAGDVIAYSGNTGYSTGPHLHFGLFVASAVRVTGPTEYKSRVCGTYLRMPIAPANAYLDPLAYLPLL